MKPFYESQMSSQTIAMSNFEETLTMWDLEVKLTLLKICDVLINDSIMLDLIGMLVPSKMYGMLRTFRYDLDWGRRASWMTFVLILL